jgi:hypothetical protein
MELPQSQGTGITRTGATNQSGLSIGDSRVKARRQSTSFSILGSSWRRTLWRVLWVSCSLCVILYSIAVLTHVARMGSIGVRCMFGTKVEEEVPDDFGWHGSRPRIGDSLVSIGPFAIHDGSYSDYIRTLRGLTGQINKTLEVRWRDQYTEVSRSALVKVQHPPSRTYFRSCVWFLQELLIFAIGARVFWKRPDDNSAQLFFAVCIFTVGAFMGGYHWTEIVTEPLLIYPFALFAVFVPVVNLHFFLVFPRANPIIEKHRRWVLCGLYGIPTAYLLALWGSMYAARWSALNQDYLQTAAAFQLLRGLALGYIALAAFLFGLCILSLVYSYRHAGTRAERSQVQWILLASLISLLLIAYLLAQAWIDPATLGRGCSAYHSCIRWPTPSA